MQPFFIRSSIFNLCFYILTAIICISLLPTLLFPRKVLIYIAKIFAYNTAFLEKYILGLTYEVRGLEHLPKEGSYIIASKHQSAYETFKLHLLFDDPAIVLKKSLLKIPLWGKYLEKSDVIAIDRSSPKIAIQSIKDGAIHVAKQGRPIVIFPQGTRVPPYTGTKERPYKIGVVRIQEATGLPIIPMALNTGLFHPKNTWCRKPGRVIFELLPPIAPSNDASSILNQIEMAVEEKTSRLIEEGEKSIPSKSKYTKTITIIALLIVGSYSANWFVSAYIAKKAIMDSFSNIKQNPQIIESQLSEPKIYGFPLKLKLKMDALRIKTLDGEMLVSSIKAQSWAMMGMPISIETGEITFSIPHWKSPMALDSIKANITFKNNVLDIAHIETNKATTQIQATGYIKFLPSQHPVIDLNIKLINYADLLNNLVKDNIIKQKAARFGSMVLKSLEKDGVVSSTLTSQDNKIYLGPIKIIELAPINPAPDL